MPLLPNGLDLAADFRFDLINLTALEELGVFGEGLLESLAGDSPRLFSDVNRIDGREV